MDINTLIKQEAPNDDDHDKAYAKALMVAYLTYKGLPLHVLKDIQEKARRSFDGSHTSTADCIILYQLIAGKG